MFACCRYARYLWEILLLPAAYYRVCVSVCLPCSRKLSQCDGILHEIEPEEDARTEDGGRLATARMISDRRKRCGENTRPRCLTPLTRPVACVHICFIQGHKREALRV